MLRTGRLAVKTARVTSALEYWKEDVAASVKREG